MHSAIDVLCEAWEALAAGQFSIRLLVGRLHSNRWVGSGAP